MDRMSVMEHVHLAGEEEDDYSGFNDYNATLDTEVNLFGVCLNINPEQNITIAFLPVTFTLQIYIGK